MTFNQDIAIKIYLRTLEEKESKLEVLKEKFSNFHCTKMKISFKDFFSKCDQIRSFLRIWSHSLKKSLMENFTFCAVFN